MSAQIQTPEEIANDVYWTIADFPDDPTGDDLRGLMARAIEADRAQRGQFDITTNIYIIQTEDGEVFDVTDNREYAEWLTREDDDTPLRTFIKESVWSGPADKGEWE